MVVLTVLLITGLVAMAVLLVCLKGFSQGVRHNKLSGAFVRVEETRIRTPRGPSKTLIHFPKPKSQPAKEPAPRRISGGTVALMSLLIALGSRGAIGDGGAASRPKSLPKSQRDATTQVPGIQPASNSR